MDTLLILIMLTNFRLLAASRLGSYIVWTAAQGILLGAYALLAGHAGAEASMLAVSLGAVALKGFVFPWLLFRAIREAGVRREIEPYVGYSMSLVVGLAALGLSFWIARHLPLPPHGPGALLVPVAFFSVFAGLFLIVSRMKAVTQVLGYIVLENGIYLFGVGMVREAPLMVELGVMLDLLVAVFVMGIMIFHISRDFAHLDTHRLRALRE
jgi:hydrogenase-4 component E